MIAVTGAMLRAIVPRYTGANHAAQERIISAIEPVIQPVLASYEINTPLRVAHFLAQIIHESAGMRTTVEFASGAAYEGRSDLGNTQPGDGRRYKGRGLLQLTGRYNYRFYGRLLGLDLEGLPHLAADPVNSLKIACLYWRQRKLNVDCDRDDLNAVTRKVNGGYNGLADRRHYLAKAKRVLASGPPLPRKELESKSRKLQFIGRIRAALKALIATVTSWFTLENLGIVKEYMTTLSSVVPMSTLFTIVLLGGAAWLVVNALDGMIVRDHEEGRYEPEEPLPPTIETEPTPEPEPTPTPPPDLYGDEYGPPVV